VRAIRHRHRLLTLLSTFDYARARASHFLLSRIFNDFKKIALSPPEPPEYCNGDAIWKWRETWPRLDYSRFATPKSERDQSGRKGASTGFPMKDVRFVSAEVAN
jgi:hypothetical protein